LKAARVGTVGGSAVQGGKTGPVTIVPEQTSVTSGPEVQQKIIAAARALASILRGTLGPRGLDKGLYKTNGEFAVTSDGARILSGLLIKNPGAKMLVSLGRSQEANVGDGVTSTVLLAGALLDEAGRLLRKGVHPLIVVDGYRAATKIAVENLESIQFPCSITDTDLLSRVVATALTGRAAEAEDERFGAMMVEALSHVSQVGDNGVICDSEDILFDKSGEGGLADSRLIFGTHWKQRIPMQKMAGLRENVSIAILDCDIKQRESKRDTEIELTSAEELEAFITAQESLNEKIAEKLIATGADIFCCSGEVERAVLHRLALADKVVLSDLDVKQLRHLAKASCGRIIEHLSDLSATDLGCAGSITCERRAATDEVQDRIIIDGCKGPLVTCLIGSSMGTEEVIRGLYDSLRACTLAISEGTLLYGGGSGHMSAASAVKVEAEKVADRTRLGMEAYARALEVIPWMLASNAGVDALDALLELRAKARASDTPVGIKVDGSIGDVSDVLEPAENLLHGLVAASETACGLLRCDQVISARGD
jgi:chaperonin GroEL (HSP60 family)